MIVIKDVTPSRHNLDVTRPTFLLSLDQLLSTSNKMNIIKFFFMLILAFAAFESIKTSPLPQDDFDDSDESVPRDKLTNDSRVMK